ncbi:MAG: SPOR domain-containing protein, partial [Alphaproteobacteria bacterium]|nr:SPOR domain-containing protein [Alphaproteobacteria bacterium]
MNDENLDLLDLDDTETVADDNLPDATPFVAPRPHRPWLLLGIGLAVIVLAVFIIIRVVGNSSSSSIEVDLDTPVTTEERPVEVIGTDVPQVPVIPAPVQELRPVVPQQPVEPVAQPVQVSEPAPVAQQAVAAEQQSVRVVEDRKEVKFQPEKTTTVAPKPVVKSAPKQVKKAVKQKTVAKTATKTTVQKVTNGGWYVQFGAYSTREAANSAEKKIRAEHPSLFKG